MILPLVFQLMILLSSLAVAKPDCLERCGNFSIPYPFGIEVDCYLDRWFAIECKSNKPFLGKIGLEVLNISPESSTMLVKHPAYKSCNMNSLYYYSYKESVNLESSPFFFSQTENVFTGLGCDNFARIRYNYSTVAGCYSSCGNIPDKKGTKGGQKGKITTSGQNKEGKETTGCFGTKCCHTKIPSVLQVFNASVLDITEDEEKECRSAFLVQEKWLIEKAQNPNFANGDFTSVPVVLDWGILDSTIKNVSVDDIGSCTIFADSTITNVSFVNDTSFFSTVWNASVHRCECGGGYEGNPYRYKGCQDIDECNRTKDICGPHMKCRNLIGSYGCYSSSQRRIDIVISGIATGLFGLLLLLGWRGHIIIKKRKDIKLKEKYFKRNGGLLLQNKLTSIDGSVDRSKLFNSNELDKATDHFNVNRILGQGGQGTVYKGMLTDGKIIAVKKSKVIDGGKIEEFINEVAILSQINHRNVVKLLGCCLETEVPLLVYEFIPNGTLFQYLHNQTKELSLTWEMRLQIATEVAEALFYLHSSASFPIYHRDIKSANILLDDKYRAKIADFGTSKSMEIDQTHVTTRVQGTFGYLDPEYFQSNQFTDKSDVYSFGVVLVELLTGQQPVSTTKSQDNRSLATRFIFSMQENNLLDILDLEVMKGKKEDIMKIAELAKRCLNLNGKKRPTMREVAMMLEGIQASQKHSNVVSTSTYSSVEEVEYVRTEAIEPWDAIPSSTFEITISSVDVEPLLST